MSPTRTLLAATVTIAALLLAPAVARADAASIQKDIDSKLKALASDLSSIPSKAEGGYAARAAAKAEELEKLYDKLGAATSGSAHEAAGKGEQDAHGLRDALAALTELKVNQDDSLELTVQCERGQAMIRGAIAQFEKKNDSAAIKLLPAAAEKAKELVQKPFADIKATRADMDRWYRTVTSWSPKLDGWKDIRDRQRRAAQGAYDTFKAKYDATEEACLRVAKGKEHPEVLAALKLLKSNHGERAKDLDGLEKEVGEYAVMLDGFRDWYRKDTEDIAAAFCEADEVGKTADYPIAPIDGVMKRIGGELKTRQDRIHGEAVTLLEALDEALPGAADAAEKARIQKVRELVAAKDKSFTTAIARGNLGQGVNNPKIRTKLEAGKIAHTQLQGRCNEAEVVLPDGTRLDCLRKCAVIEIKPDTAGGKAKGPAQAKAYHDALMALFDKDRAAFEKKLPRVAKECVTDDKLGLSADVELYRFCPEKVSELGLELVIDIETSDVMNVVLSP